MMSATVLASYANERNLPLRRVVNGFYQTYVLIEVIVRISQLI